MCNQSSRDVRRSLSESVRNVQLIVVSHPYSQSTVGEVCILFGRSWDYLRSAQPPDPPSALDVITYY